MSPNLSLNTLIGLTFSVRMSDDEFFTFLKGRGLSDMDASKVTGKYSIKITFVVSQATLTNA